MKKGWDIKTLGDIGRVSMCKRILKNQTLPIGDIPFYKIGTFGKIANAFISNKVYEEYRSKYSFPKKGDILLSASGTIGRRVIYDGEPAYFQDSNIVWIDNDEEKVLNEYLFLFYGFCDWNPSKGATISRLYNDDLRRIKIPLPPLPEQQRIVAILDETFTAIAKAKANAQQNLKNAKELFESYLQGVFTSAGSATENKGEGWEEKTLDEVCEISSKLIDPKKKEFQNLIHIGAGNIETKKGTLADLKTAKEENLISGKFLFDETMVLYSKIRPYLMKVVNCNFQGLCSADIYPLLPFKDKMTKDFLYHLLLTKKFTDYAILGSQRAGMPKVNREHLFAYRFNLPPLNTQQTIVQKLNALNVETKKLESIYQQKIKDLEELKKSVLQKAFSGELKTVRGEV